jgi:hypothetical protein
MPTESFHRVVMALPVAVAFTFAFAGTAVAAPPSNDDFNRAQRITTPGMYEGTVLEASGELGERPILGRATQRSIWFRYKARCTCEHEVDTGGSDFDSVLAVYTGSALNDLRLIGENDDASPSAPRGALVRFRARKGRNLYIAVDSYDADVAPQESKVQLTVSDGSIAGEGVTMAVEDGQTVDSLRSAGLKLGVSARRATGVRVALLITKRTARRLGLRRTVLGRLSGSLDYEQTLDGTIPLTAAARRALRGESRLVATVRLTLRSDAPDRVLRERVRLGG